MHHARRPAPALVDLHPAAIMERRKPPRRIVHPGPAPGLHIRPVTVAVRHPVMRDRRIPDMTVSGRARPIAAGLQILGAGHLLHLGRRQVGRAPHHPAGPAGRALRQRRQRLLRQQLRGQEGVVAFRPDTALEIVGADQRGGLVRADLQREVDASDLCRAVHHGDGGRTLGVAGDDLITSDRRDADGAARCRDAVALPRTNQVDGQIDRALRLGGGEVLRIQGVDVELGLLIECRVRRVDVDGGGGSRLGPECVAGGDRVVDGRRLPMVLVRGVERDRAGDAGQAADARWRVGRVDVGGGGGAGGCGRRQRRQRPQRL